MREATFIQGMVVNKVLINNDYVVYRDNVKPRMAIDGNFLYGVDGTVTTRVVPVTHICGFGKADLYIAYSEEVEELLGIPIRVILKDTAEANRGRDAAVSRADKLESMGIWDHLKAAWKVLIKRHCKT